MPHEALQSNLHEVSACRVGVLCHALTAGIAPNGLLNPHKIESSNHPDYLTRLDLVTHRARSSPLSPGSRPFLASLSGSS